MAPLVPNPSHMPELILSSPLGPPNKPRGKDNAFCFVLFLTNLKLPEDKDCIIHLFLSSCT